MCVWGGGGEGGEKGKQREKETLLSCGEVGSFVSVFFICSEYRVKIELTMGATPVSSPVIWFRGKLRRGLWGLLFRMWSLEASI